MTRQASRERSKGEVVFGLLRALMVGYHLWGTRSGCVVADLSTSLHTTEAGLGGVLTYLAGEGLVALDQASGTVRLTHDGARSLLAHPAGMA